LLECKIYFAVVGVQNLFCGPTGMQVFFRWEWNVPIPPTPSESKINFALQAKAK
jgi:hypothetical protein